MEMSATISAALIANMRATLADVLTHRRCMVRTYEEIADTQDLKNNKLLLADRAFHDWYRFVLSYPPQLVRSYIERFQLSNDAVILDPFCGTGTTIVEAKKNQIQAIGIEANPMAQYASAAKVDWQLDPNQVLRQAEHIVHLAIERDGQTPDLLDFTPEQRSLILKNSISDLPLHKCLILRDAIRHSQTSQSDDQQRLTRLFEVALAYVVVNDASNLKFGPEVSVRRKKRDDAAVFELWYERIRQMILDLESAQAKSYPNTICHHADARSIRSVLSSQSIDAIITSPPYPNEKDYTRATRLESVLLGFFNTKLELRNFKQHLMRSNTRNVYVADDDDICLSPDSEVLRLAHEIERRRISMQKTSGFEKLYHRATTLYFGGMKRHFSELRPFLKPGAKLAYVVGDQASFLQVMLRTGELLADIAQELGYRVLDIDLFRTRLSTATGEQLREEVVILEWPGVHTSSSILFSFAALESQIDSTPIAPAPQIAENIANRFIEQVFFAAYQLGDRQVLITADLLQQTARRLDISPQVHLGYLLYSYRYQRSLPPNITALLPTDETWCIRSEGRGQYSFTATVTNPIEPNPKLQPTELAVSLPTYQRLTQQSERDFLLALLKDSTLRQLWLSNCGEWLTDHGSELWNSRIVYPAEKDAPSAPQRTDLLFLSCDRPLSQKLVMEALSAYSQRYPDQVCTAIGLYSLPANQWAVLHLECVGSSILIQQEYRYQLAEIAATSTEI